MEPVHIPFFAWSIITAVVTFTAGFVGTAIWRYADQTKQRIDKLDDHIREIDNRVVRLESQREPRNWASTAL